MLEKELKILSIDPIMIGTLLLKYGAEQKFDGYIYDIYFDTTNRSLQAHKYSVRLRFQNNTCILAFKQKKKHKTIKCMIEKEFIVHDIFFVLWLLF
jgi:adenylate cyclase class IV